MIESVTSTRTRRAWIRRAETIKRKSEELFRDIYVAMGEDHPLTDFADNLIHANEEFTDALDRFQKNVSATKKDVANRKTSG